MAFPSPAVNGQTYVNGGYTYQYNSARKTWTKINVNTQQIANSLVTGNSTANTTVTGNTVAVANTTANISTTVTPSNIVVSNTTANTSTTVTPANVTIANTAANTSTTVTPANVVIGNSTANTKITSNTVTTGNSTANTTITSTAVTIANATSNSTITPNSITTGNTVISNSNITIGNSVINSNTITSNTYYGNTYYGNTYYGNDIFLTGNLTANGNVIANQYGVVGNVLYVGPGAFGVTGFNNPIMIGTKSGGDFVQSLIINTSNTGSSDWVAQGDNGNDITGYADFGFTGSNFSDPAYTILGKNDSFVLSVGVGGANLGGNLVFGTSSLGQNNDIVFATGGFLSANEKMRFINAQNQLYIKTTTPATNSTTGSLRVAGGVGIAGNLYVGGLINSAANINAANLTTGGNLTVTNTANIGNLNVSGNVTGNFTGGNIDTSGNVTAGNLSTTGTANVGTLAVTGNANITGNANVGNLSTTGTANVGNLGFGAGQITGTGNITGGNIIGTIAAGSNTITTTGNANLGNLGFGSGQITGTGNITGGNIIGTIAAGSNTITTTGNANLGNIGFGSGVITGTGNITGGNIIGTIAAGSNTISTTGNANLGNLGFGSGQITGTGNITGGNIIGTIAAGSNTISTTGNANVGNLGFGTGEVTGTGNITGGNIIGTIAAGSNTITTTGNANVGPLSVTGNANISGNIVTSNLTVNLELSGNTANFSGNVYASYFVGNISGNIAAPGSNTYVLFNNNNLVNGVANFTFQNTSNTLTTDNISLNKNLGVGGNANITGNILANGSITTANSFNLSNTSTGNNIFSVQDQSGTPVIEMGRIDSNPSTPAIDFHSGSTLVDYDSKIQASSGNGAVGGGNLTVTANYFNVSNNLIANGNANISGNANVTGNVTANNFILNGGNITGANLISANYFTGTLTTSAQPNVTSLGTLSNLFISGNLGVGTATLTADARVTILAVGQTNVYPITGNSIAAGTDLHISGDDGNITRITQDSFGLNTYVAFTGRAAGGTATAPTQTLTGATLSQFTGRGFSNGSLQFGNNSTGRVDIEAAENFTDTSRSTNVVIYTTSVGNINPTLAATFDGNGNLTVTGSITSTSGNSNLGNSITANFVSVSSNTVTSNLKVNLEFSGNTANFSGNIFTANANLGNVANANFFSGNGSLLTGITFANLTDANTAGLTINDVYLQGVTNLAVSNTGATGYTFDQYPGLNPSLYVVAGTTLAFDLTTVGHPFQIQYANGTDYSNGLFHVTTAGVVSTGASAQSQTSGTLYWKVPGDINGTFKYQCQNHVAMVGNIFVQAADIGNVLLNYTGNLSAGNANLGNAVAANFFIGNGFYLTGIDSAGVANGNSNVKVYSNANVEISANGVANVLSITGSAVVASQNVYANANTIQANIIVGNTLTGNLSTAAQPNITSVGSLTSLTVTGDIVGNTANFNGAAYSNATSISAPTQLATKSYVDQQVSTGIHIHEAVYVATTANLIATYIPGGTNPVITEIVTGNTLISTGHNLNVNNMVVPTVTSSGLTSGTPYFVYSVANANAFTLTASWSGPQLTGLTNGTGLSITSNANPGIGAKLTNAGTQAALTIDSIPLSLTNRVLVLNQANTALNGVYAVSNVGSVSTNWELTRALDADQYYPQSDLGIGEGSYFFVQSGNTQAGDSYVVSTAGIIIIGTTGISFSQFSGAVTYTGVSPIVVTGQQISLANTTGSSDVVVLATSPNLTTPNIGNATGNSLTLSGNGLVSAANVTASANITAGNLNTSGQIISTGAGNASDGGGQLYLNGSGNNRIDFNINGTGAPANTTRSAGTKITLYPALSVSQTDYALGIDSGTVWTSVPVNSSSFKFKWYGGITEVANLDGTGNFSAAGNITGGNITTTGQIVSSVATGTAPLAVSSNTVVPNLNAAFSNIANNVAVTTVSTNISYPTFAYANITGSYPLQSNTAISANLANGAFIATTFVGNVSGNVSNGALANGNSNVNIPAANGNVNISAVGNANILVVTGTGANITGTANVTGNANVGGNINVTSDVIAGNIYANSGTIGGSLVAGTLTTAAQPNITSLGALTGLTVSNATGVVNFTTTANVTLGAVANLKISGGSSGYVLSTDGASNLSWVAQSGGSAASISNGTSNVNIPASSGNVNISSAGNANVVVITGAGMNVAGTINGTGNITGANLIAGAGSGGNITGANLVSANYFTGTLTTAAQPNITSLGTLTGLTSTGTANFTGASNVSLGAIGNVKITGGSASQYLQTDGAGNLSFVTISASATSISNGNSNVNIPAANGNVTISAVGNANILVVTGTGANITGTGNFSSNLSAANFVGTLANGNSNITMVSNANVAIAVTGANRLVVTSTGANITGTGNFSGNLSAANFIGTLANGNSNITMVSNANVAIAVTGANRLVVTSTGANITGTANISGNANVGNLGFGTGEVTGTGNITGGNIIGIIAAGSNTITTTGNITGGNLLGPHANGNSNVNIPAANGNVNISAVGNANVVVITGTGMNVAGTIDATGNITGGNIVTGGGLGGSITGANLISANYFTGTLTTAAQPNITSLGTLTGLTSTGTINFTGASNVSLGANGNVKITGGTNGQVLTTDGTGNLSFTTVSGGGGAAISNGTSYANITASGGNVVLAVAGTIRANVTSTGLDVTGNITSGNANITGQYISTLATGNAPFIVTSTTQVANLSVATAGTAVTVTGAAQSNITSVGTLSNLGVSGTVTASQIVSNVATGTAPITVSSTTRVANLNVAYANVSDFGAVTNQTTGTYYPVFVSSNATGNYALAANGTFTANIANGAFIANSFVAGAGSGGNITGANTVNANTFTAGSGSGGNITGANTISANYFIGATGLDFTTASNVALGANGTVTDGVSNTYAIGYKAVPQSTTASGNFVLSDSAKHVYVSAGVTVPANASVAFSIGTVLTVVNSSASSITITQGSGVTLRQTGTANTGNRTLSGYGLCSCIKVASDTWYISGTGLS